MRLSMQVDNVVIFDVTLFEPVTEETEEDSVTLSDLTSMLSNETHTDNHRAVGFGGSFYEDDE